MKNTTLILLFGALLLIVACMQKGVEISSEQSVQDIVSETTDYEDITNKTQTTAEEEIGTKNATIIHANQSQTTAEEKSVEKEETETISGDVPLINKKCRNSTILYGGCKWNDENQTTFDMKIKNDGRIDIPGGWMVITGESGGVRNIKRTELLAVGAIRTYNIDYVSLVKEIGKITRLEFLPIEIINKTEYACYNMRVYTIPETNCKTHAPVSMD